MDPRFDYTYATAPEFMMEIDTEPTEFLASELPAHVQAFLAEQRNALDLQN